MQTLASKYINIAALDEDNNQWLAQTLSEYGDEQVFPIRLNTTESGDFKFSWEGIEHFSDDMVFTLLDIETGNSIELIKNQDYYFMNDEAKTKTHQSDQLFSLEDQNRNTTSGALKSEPRFFLQINNRNSLSSEPNNGIPETFTLNQNYPNPFNPSSTIQFGIPEASNVRLEVFNLLGQKVSTLVAGDKMQAGWHSVQFDAGNLASGVYIYRIEAGNFVQTKRMMLIK